MSIGENVVVPEDVLKELGEVSDVVKFVSCVYTKKQDPEYAWVYRGEPHSGSPCTPKIDRPDFVKYREEHGWSRTTHEEWLLKEFQKFARPHLRIPPTTTWEWLALAQHHGLATRLLDWTSNPLAALFFAVEQNAGVDAVVWGLSDRGMTSSIAHDNPLVLTTVVMYYPPHLTSRITVQAGCFTAMPDSAKSPLKWGAKRLRIRIPGAARKDVRKQLSKLGITRATLFPDMDGAAATLNWAYALPTEPSQRAAQPSRAKKPATTPRKK